MFLLNFSTLLDPEEIVQADGKDNAKTSLKAMGFPLFDDPDALASSHIQKVLGAIAKWQCKMMTLKNGMDAAASDVPSCGTLLILIHVTNLLCIDVWKAG